MERGCGQWNVKVPHVSKGQRGEVIFREFLTNFSLLRYPSLALATPFSTIHTLESSPSRPSSGLDNVDGKRQNRRGSRTRTVIQRHRIPRPRPLDRNKRPIRQRTPILDAQHIAVRSKRRPLHQRPLRNLVGGGVRRVRHVEQGRGGALQSNLARVVGVVQRVGGCGVVLLQEELCGGGLCGGEAGGEVQCQWYGWRGACGEGR
jgi:hypothetical protein